MITKKVVITFLLILKLVCNKLLNSITDIQTIITCTGLEEFVKNRFQIDKIFQVINGEVFEKKTIEDI